MSDTEALTERILGAALATTDMFAIHLGDRLGYYCALRGQPASAVELAGRTTGRSDLSRDAMKPPAARDALEFAISKILEPMLRARHEIPHGLGHEDL
jgi:hypothetical protein